MPSESSMISVPPSSLSARGVDVVVGVVVTHFVGVVF